MRRNRSSLSRTSASASDRVHHHQPIPNPGGPKSKRSSQSRSRSNTSSQSPSLPSPSSPTFSEAHIVSPTTVEQGQGFFNLEDELPVREGERIRASEFPVRRIGGGSFPMTGFAGTGNVGGGGKRSRDFGAFLARRGDEEEGRAGDVDIFSRVSRLLSPSCFTPGHMSLPNHVCFLYMLILNYIYWMDGGLV